MSPGRVKVRYIKGLLPKYNVWKPQGVKDIEETITISVAEWEAIRLCDLENNKQREAAELMHISQPTLNRLLSSGRSKIAKALINGMMLNFEDSILECPICHGHLSAGDGAEEDEINCPKCDTIIERV